MDFKTFAAAHTEEQPLPEYLKKQSEADRIRERTTRENAQEVEKLKESIFRQLEAGGAPQYILYGALQAIGLLTQDLSWAEKSQQLLDGIYADLAQESFIVDNSAIAAQRLETQKAAYLERMRKQLNRDINICRNIEKDIDQLLSDLQRLETQPEN